MKKNFGKRILSMFLAFTMIITLIPSSLIRVEAASTLIDAAIFASDIHGNTGVVSSVFSAIKTNEEKLDSTFNPSTATFAGDTNNVSNGTGGGGGSTMNASVSTEEAKGVFEKISCYYTYGSHDSESLGVENITGLIYGDSSTNYYIYAISQSDMENASNASTKASSFTSGISDLDKTKPLFIVSHMPLHARRSDNNGASAWYSAISSAAEKMDIVFFWGHNHTNENETDEAAFYVAKDGTEKLNVYNGSSEVPNFTYMNAGYIGKDSSRGGVATTVKIYSDTMVFQDYTSSGAFTGEYAHNVEVAREFASTDSGSSGGDTDTGTDEDTPTEGGENEDTSIGTTTDGTVTIGGTITSKKTVYVLSSGNPSGNVLIANSATAGTVNLVANDGGGLSNTTSTVVYGDCDGDGDSEYYIELTDATNELWTVSGSYTFENQDEYLRYNNGLSVSSSSTTWSYSNNRLTYRSGNSTRYLRYDNGWTTTSQSNRASSIYFYVPTEVDIKVDTKVTYSLSANDINHICGDTTGKTIIPSLASNGSPITSITDEGKYSYTIDSDANGIIQSIDQATGEITFTGYEGEAKVKVSYTWTQDGTSYEVYDIITVTAKLPYYSIDLHYADMTEVSITEFADGVTYYTYDSITNTYNVATEYVEGTTYYTTPVIKGDEITEPVALKGIEAGDTYSVWAVVKEYNSEKPNGEDLGELGNVLTWKVSDESIATIDANTGLITFTGNNYGTFTVTVSYKGADNKTITDTITISVTDTLYVVPGDGTNDFPEYPNEGAVRFDKTATAVGNFSETGIAKVELSMTGVPYTTGNAIDALLVLDMSTSMKTVVDDNDTTSEDDDVSRYEVTAAATKAFIKTIVQNSDGTYNSNTVAVHYFNGTTAYTDKITNGYITISSDEELQAIYDKIDALIDNPPGTSGTDYSTSMKTAYDTIIARDKVSDNTQALVFMSDGGPTYYTYVNGTSYGTVSNNAATIVGWFETNNNGTTNDETDDTATPNSSFKNEYYSTLLKNAGYPIYTVGLGLSSNDTGPSAFTGLTSGAHEAITSYILAQMATSSSYFYNVADEDAVANMGNIFSSIAASIKEAATNVEVKDKIGNNYSINFSLPSGITSNATDGLSEFYIQVVDYVLDSTTHERTGVYTVKENFTFNANGTLKSHTVDGTACSACSHVTFTDGKITAIDGTYFEYELDGTDEYLYWNEEKLTSNELALQYFVYLEDSAGTDVKEQVAAGTYYTNEYATLTYTNVNGNEVQQEFPIPQMTWNGAQVSYVFYLVNADGVPVNRAGRVVPFAEAIYVTNVFTKSVVWNDMEQSAGLEAKYLAENLVPEVYALYDDDASYNIHVYEDESKVNLNNHFVIGGNVADDYNTTTNSWTNANTTYVFNNKSDVTKYNTVGTYVSEDGDATANETGLSYFCKSDPIVGATYTTSLDGDVTVYDITIPEGYTVDGQTTVTEIQKAGGSTTGGDVIGDYVYYVDENGAVYTIVTKKDGKEVDKGFDFSNTTVAFAVVWKPELTQDTVVIDYGLDVVIDVIKNDNMAAGVTGVMLTAPDANTEGTYQNSVGLASINSTDGIWTASKESLTSVRFHLNNMEMNKEATFYYEAGVNYYKDEELQTTNMYSSVTVIPATTIYYEDNFISFKTESSSGSAIDNAWTTDGTVTNKTQDVDRPGSANQALGSLYDANNVYGYDSAYKECTKYSLGSAHTITVDSSMRGIAEFSFNGTGFDIIGLTDKTTGTLIVQVFDESGNSVKTSIIDTYYGYTYNEETGEWTITSSTASNAIYQVPVMKIDDLTYGKYNVKLTAGYNSYFDHDDDGKYTLYLDAVRIYNPANDSAGAIKDAYDKDNEAYPEYLELRNQLIDSTTFDSVTTDSIGGLVFIDGIAKLADIGTYKSYGPNNEVYLAENQSITFKLNKTAFKNADGTALEPTSIQIGLKSANGTTINYKLFNASTNAENASTKTLSTTTDMYYDITGLNSNEPIIISNVGSGILSITNIKFTFDEKVVETTNPVVVNEEIVSYALRSLRYVAPTTFVPEVFNITLEETVEVGTNVNVNVTTSTDVEYIYVNDTLVSTYEDKDTTRTFTTTIPTTEVGTLEVNVVAYNGDDLVSETSCYAKVTVTEKTFTPDTFKVSVVDTTVVSTTIKLTVTTSKDVEKVTVNGDEITTYRTNRFNGQKTWTMNIKANEVGEMTFDVVAFDAEGTACTPITEVVTVKTVKTIIKDIFDWIFG